MFRICGFETHTKTIKMFLIVHLSGVDFDDWTNVNYFWDIDVFHSVNYSWDIDVLQKLNMLCVTWELLTWDFVSCFDVDPSEILSQNDRKYSWSWKLRTDRRLIVCRYFSFLS